MANSHEMKVNLGFSMNSDIDSSVGSVDKLNSAMESSARSAKQLVDEVGRIASSLKKMNDSTKASPASAWLDQQKQMYKSGLISREEYNKAVLQKEGQLYRELKQMQSNGDTKSNVFQEKLKDHQAYVKQVNQINKEYTKAMQDAENKAKEILDRQAKAEEEASRRSAEASRERAEAESRSAEQLRQIQEQREQSTRESATRRAEAERQAQQQITNSLRSATKEQEVEMKSRASFTNKEINSMISSYKRLNNEIQKMAQPKKNALSTNGIFDSMLAMYGVQQVTQAFQDLGRAIVEVDYNVVNNQRLMGDFSDGLRDKLNSAAIDIAKSTGIQITDAQQIQGAWIRINDQYAKNADTLNSISKLTSEFMNVGEIQDAEHAVALLNASLLQFGVTADQSVAKSEEFLNKWAYMADKTAMGTADEYGEAIANYGTNLKAVGGTMDDAIVQSSVLADSLAMNGKEAGTALKTFNTYLTRDKTLELFEGIAEETGDTSYNLADANGKLKDYRTLLETVGRAYKMYRDQGNDVQANKILDAVGATRRRDVAMAMLDAANGGLDKYYDMLAEMPNNYLEDQNAALMDTLKNQWNSFVVSLQGAGVALGNAGLLDGLTNIINVGQSALDVIGNMPESALQAANAFILLSTATLGLRKIGEITGITEKLKTAFTSGGQASRQMAADISASTAKFMDTQKWMLQSAESANKTTQAYADTQNATREFAQGMNELGEAYTKGEINATQYASRVGELQSAYREQLASIREVAQSEEQYTASCLESAEAMRDRAQSALQLAQQQLQVAEANLKSAEAERLSATTAEEVAKADAKVAEAQRQRLSAEENVIAKEQQLANAERNVIQARHEHANATKEADAANKMYKQSEENLAKTIDKSSNAEKKKGISLKGSIASLKDKLASLVGLTAAEGASTGATKAFTWAQIAGAAASNLFAGAINAVKMALGMFLNPLTLITAAISILPALFGNTSTSLDEGKTKLDEYSSKLEEVESRIQELRDIESQGGKLSEGQQQELAFLEQKKVKLEELIATQQKLNANSEYTDHQGGFLGFGGEDSGYEKNEKAIKSFQKWKGEVDTAGKILENWQNNTTSSETYKNSMVEDSYKRLQNSNDEYLQAATEVVDRYQSLQDSINNGDLTGDALEKAKAQLKEMAPAYEEASVAVKKFAGENSEAMTSSADAIEQYTSALEEAYSAVEELTKKANGIEEAFNKHQQGTTFNTDEMYELLQIAPELKDSFKEVSDGQYEATESLETILNRYREGAQEAKEEFVDTAMKGEEAFMQQGEAIDEATGKVKENTQALDENAQKQKQQVEKLTEAQQKIKSAIEEAYKGTDKKFSFEADIKPITFDIDYTSIDQAKDGISQIQAKIAEVQANKDISPEVQTAQLEYLYSQLDMAVQKKQGLTPPAFMKLDVSQVDSGLQYALQKLQEFQTACNELERLSLQPDADTSEAQAKVDQLAQQLANLPDDVKTSIGLEIDQNSDINAQIESIKSQIESGSLKFDATLNTDKINQEVQDVVAKVENADANIDVTFKAEGLQDIKDKLSSVKDKNITVTAETKSDQLTVLENRLKGLKDKEVNVSVSSSGAEQVDTIHSQLNGLPTDIAINLSVNADEVGIANILSIINNIKDVSASISVTTSGTDGVNKLSGAIDNVKGKSVDVGADVSGKSEVNALIGAIKDLKGKTVSVGANVFGLSSVNSLVNAIANVINKTVTITTIKKTIGKGSWQGTANAYGTANARGNWGAPRTETALVGELGREIIVRGNSWFTVGDNGAEFTKIRKGDIVFNHVQTRSLLENGKINSRGKAMAEGTVGKAFVGGTAFADGTPREPYKSSYKVTDDKTVANTIAVKRASQEAYAAIQRAQNASEDAAEALEKAAKEAEEIAKEIESITSKFIKNVEDLQKRIADSLKDHWETEYKDREKVLKKEHDARIEGLQKEIDLINGETVEDKEAELKKLQAQLDKWSKDDSTLGRKKQKELQDAIDDLTKEIKVDKLEQQIEDENKRYDEATDKESENLDPILKDLLNKMDDENLYKTANDLIKKGDATTIGKLLKEHDSQWDGWKTLQGMTAGQIIDEEVRDALNNYKDVIGGTITKDGGQYSDGVNIPKPNAGGSGPAQPAIGVGSRINAGSAPIYGSAGGHGYKQYFSSDPIYTVVKEQGDWLLTRWHKLSSGLTGWFKKSDVKAYAKGGVAYETGMAQLDGTRFAPERVLDPRQTEAFDNLVYDFLPQISSQLLNHGASVGDTVNHNNTVFNKELVKVEVDTVINNTPSDIANSEDNMDRLFRRSLRKSGIVMPK